MRRKFVLPMVSVLTALLLVPLGAARSETAPEIPRDLEIVVRELEGLLLELSGARDVKPVFREHGGGLYSLSVRLPEDSPLRTHAAAARPLTTLAAGHQVSDPGDNQSVLINAVRSSVGFDYNFWWVALNTSEDDITRKTTNTIKGPGLSFTRNDTLTYDDLSTHLFWFPVEEVFENVGLFTHKVKITKAGAVKYKLFAD